MRTYFLPAVMLLGISLASCKDTAMVKSETETALPMPVAYIGEPSVGSNTNTVTVMNWNRYLSQGKLDSAFTLLADSITVRMSGGEMINTTRDSAKAIMNTFFNNLSQITIQYVAVVPIDVKLSDTNTDQWVLSWTDEEYVMKDGKTEHILIHEDYRLVNGKIREVNQYKREVAPKVTEEKK